MEKAISARGYTCSASATLVKLLLDIPGLDTSVSKIQHVNITVVRHTKNTSAFRKHSEFGCKITSFSWFCIFTIWTQSRILLFPMYCFDWGHIISQHRSFLFLSRPSRTSKRQKKVLPLKVRQASGWYIMKTQHCVFLHTLLSCYMKPSG